MIINEDSSYKGVNGFSDGELHLMCAFLQGAVYCWCKNRKNEWFAVRDLLGGDNFYWEGTPLFLLFKYYCDGDNAKSEYALEEAGKAAGRLLKRVLIDDKRCFETRKGYTREYRWNGIENNG